jgi:hypothetical protein
MILGYVTGFVDTVKSKGKTGSYPVKAFGKGNAEAVKVRLPSSFYLAAVGNGDKFEILKALDTMRNILASASNLLGKPSLRGKGVNGPTRKIL